MLVKIKDIANIVAGQSPESAYYSQNKNDTPFLQGNRTFGGKYPFIDTYTSKVTKMAHKGDVLISVRAPVGDLNIANTNLCIGRGLASMTAKDGDNEFLYYALKANMNNIINKGNGTTYDSITADVIKDSEIFIPDNEEKRKEISHILSSIDNQIERNNNMVQSLQVLAQSTYSRWFNQFEFPHDNGKSYKSDGGKMVYNSELKKEIPEGWKVDNLGKLIIENKKSVIKAGESTEGDFPFFTSGDEISTYNLGIINGKNCYLNTGGNAGIKYFSKDCAYSTDTRSITSNQYYEEYLYLYLNSIIGIIDRNYFAGSGLKHLQKEALKNIKIIIPDENTMKKFSSIVSPIFDFISNNYFKTKRLESLKDKLLPLLINGQLS